MSKLLLDRLRSLNRCFSNAELELLEKNDRFAQAAARAPDSVEDFEQLCVLGRKLLLEMGAPAALRRGYVD